MKHKNPKRILPLILKKMLNHLIEFRSKKIAPFALITGIICSPLIIKDFSNPRPSFSAPSLLEFRWDNSTSYKKLYYFQSSDRKRERSTYYLVLKPNDRKSAILKLSIKVPERFNANIRTHKLSLCEVHLGGMLTRTKCKNKIPAIFEIDQKQTTIDIFPEQPIPVDGAYALVMKIFNPSNAGMYQFNALAQAPGDIPMAGYLGSWSIDIE